MRAIAQRAAYAVTASLALLTSTAHAETCWYPQEAKAAQLRDFHIMLMVGTLQCKTTSPATVRDYNSFVSRQNLVLDTNRHLLRDHFLRDVGPDQVDSAYDSYSTATANALEHKITADPNVCARIDTLARVAAVANFADLMVLAQTFEGREFNTSCPVSAYPVAEEPLPPRNVPVTVASASPAPLPYAASPDGAPPLNQADDAAAWKAGFGSGNSAEANTPPPVAAREEEAPAQSVAAVSPANDPAQMKAALAALQAAVSALQAAQATGTATRPTLTAGHAPVGKAELIAVKVQDAPVIPPKD
jgi:hypothetical protein